MLINRNNYESFFLLYVDGELRADEMRIVEDFAAANDDLAAELKMLQAAVLPMDDVLFEDKGELYKPVPIDSILYEKLLLKLDNELPANEQGSLNELIAADENVNGEFNLLQRTKLDAADKIVFADKHLLYRKERDNVIAGRFVRWAAAAVLLGFGFYFGANMLNKKKTDAGIPVAATKIPAAQKGTGTTNPSSAAGPQNITAVSTDTDVSTNNTTASVNTTSAAQNNDNTNRNNTGDRKNGNNQQSALNANNTADPNNGIAKQDGLPQQKEDIAPVQKINNEPSTEVVKIAPKDIKTQVPIISTMVPLEDPYAHVVALNNDDKNNDKILYMDEDDVKRSKVGGFFRKVKRLAERTAKVKTGNTLRIAGFSIASK